MSCWREIKNFVFEASSSSTCAGEALPVLTFMLLQKRQPRWDRHLDTLWPWENYTGLPFFKISRCLGSRQHVWLLYSPTLPSHHFVIQFSPDTSLDWMFDLIWDQHDYDGLAIMMVSCVQTNVWGMVTNIRSVTSNEQGGLQKTQGQVTDWTLMISPDCTDRWCLPPSPLTTTLSHLFHTHLLIAL